jgi:acyl-CoA synthetase (AMP-forming)/AMP-acid ligase II
MPSHKFNAAHRELAAWRFREIRNIADIPRYWAHTTPEKPALVNATRQLNWAALNARANAIANRLAEFGVPPGTPVGYLGKNAPEFFEIWFGCAKAGCALTPFNWRCAIEELVAIVEDAAPPIIFVSDEFLSTLDAVKARTGARFHIVPFGVDGLTTWLDGAAETDPLILLTPGDIALISYTSGTTGRPKGVLASHEAFAWSFLSGVLEPAMSATAEDVMLVSMPGFHLGGSWISLSALYRGATLSILPTFDPTDFIAAAARDGATMAALVPTAIQRLLSRPVGELDALKSLRFIMYFGSPAGADLLLRAAELLDCRLAQCYGTTESWIISMLDHEQDLPCHPHRLASAGRALPLVSVKIAAPNGVELPIGSVGEILVRSPAALSGYHNQPEALAEAMYDGWYRTGDLGRFDEDGFLYLMDRTKDMIISGGENIYSVEVEQALAKLAGVAACAVVGLPDEKWGERVVAAIVSTPGTTLTTEAVIAHCRGLIAGYKVPKEVRFLDALPQTSIGKIRKHALREALRQHG